MVKKWILRFHKFCPSYTDKRDNIPLWIKSWRRRQCKRWAASQLSDQAHRDSVSCAWYGWCPYTNRELSMSTSFSAWSWDILFFCYPLMWSPPYLRQGSLILMSRAQRLLRGSVDEQQDIRIMSRNHNNKCFLLNLLSLICIFILLKNMFLMVIWLGFFPTSNKIRKHRWLLFTVDIVCLHSPWYHLWSFFHHKFQIYPVRVHMDIGLPLCQMISVVPSLREQRSFFLSCSPVFYAWDPDGSFITLLI